jgi:Ankyrin repeats (3 copies)
LHAAAGSGGVDILLLLLDKGLTLNSSDWRYRTGKGQTPLHCAAQGGHIAMVQLLLDKACDVNDTDTDGNTALRLCLHGPNDAAACLLQFVSAGADVLDITTDTRYDYFAVTSVYCSSAASAQLQNQQVCSFAVLMCSQKA